jgi:hypothetical protein
MQKFLIAVLISLLSILILSGIANAQPAPTATGTLRGAVATAAPDRQPYNVPGASLKLMTPTQTLDAVTDNAGEYQFTNLLPGAYTLNTTVQGFKAASKIVTIRAGETSVEYINLEVAKPASDRCALCIDSLNQELANYELLIAQLESEISRLRSEIKERVKLYNVELEERAKFGQRVQS